MVSNEYTFVFSKTGTIPVCSYQLITTEHPKIFIFETTPNDVFLKKEDLKIENLYIFTYINLKFIYVERHVRTEMNRLYRDVLHQRCTLER